MTSTGAINTQPSSDGTEIRRLLERATALEAQVRASRVATPSAEWSAPGTGGLAPSTPAAFRTGDRLPPLQRPLAQMEEESRRLVQGTWPEPMEGTAGAPPQPDASRARYLLAHQGFDADRLERCVEKVAFAELQPSLPLFARTDLESALRYQHELAVLNGVEESQLRTGQALEQAWESQMARDWARRRREMLSALGYTERPALSASMTSSAVSAGRARSALDASSFLSTSSLGTSRRASRSPMDAMQVAGGSGGGSGSVRSPAELDFAAVLLSVVDPRPGRSRDAPASSPVNSGVSKVLGMSPSASSVPPRLATALWRAARKERLAAREPRNQPSSSSSSSEMCYDALRYMLGEVHGFGAPGGGDVVDTAAMSGWARVPTEGTLRPATAHRSRFVSGAIRWLSEQFRWYRLHPAIEREPEIAALGGEPGVLAEVRAYLRVMEAATTVSTSLRGWLSQNPWAEMYYCLRCGDLEAALRAAEDWLSPSGGNYASDELDNFSTYLRAFVQSARRRSRALLQEPGSVDDAEAAATLMPGVCGALPEVMLAQLVQEYALIAHVPHLARRIPDWRHRSPHGREDDTSAAHPMVFRRACYLLMARLNCTAAEGMELPESDYAILFASIEDYLWMRLWTCRLVAEETEAAAWRADEPLSPPLQRLQLRLIDVQEEIVRYGAAHFDPSGTRPLFYALVLLLTGHFEAALAHLAQPRAALPSAGGHDPLIDAVHLAWVLDYYGAIRECPSEGIDGDGGDVSFDYAETLWRYLQRPRGGTTLAKADPVTAAAYLMTVRDAPRRAAALRRLVLDTGEYALLLGSLTADGRSRRAGAVERYGAVAYTMRTADAEQEWADIAHSCAAACESAGDEGNALMLYDLAGDTEQVLALLLRALCQRKLSVRAWETSAAAGRTDGARCTTVADTAADYYARYERNGTLDALRSPVADTADGASGISRAQRLVRSVDMALQLARLFEMVYDARAPHASSQGLSGTHSGGDRFEAALALLQQVQLLPLQREQLESKAEAVRRGGPYDDALLERLPDILLTAMRVLTHLAEATRYTLRHLHTHHERERGGADNGLHRDRRAREQAEQRALLEHRLLQWREMAHAIVTFSGRIRTNQAEVNAELVRLEVQLC
ncbi:hypothetical protein CDCA_CDCA10G3012 [Cyanidium caldarium]|uniref:Nuclear pore protein n=1 Tax=Cyanidium caldarium TaxID=2771 RepID=A0AAV9IXC8_CYACA|nr:hypothetical protein CDCA_CDCA10G3012 [Cyanidium caldarium]